PAPPRRSRGGLPGRSTTGRRASVLPPGWPASARGPASFHGALRSGKGHASAARYGGAHPAREDCHPGLGGGAPGRGLGDRRLASLSARSGLTTSPIAPVLGVSAAEIRPADEVVAEQLRRWAAEGDATGLHHVGAVGH